MFGVFDPSSLGGDLLRLCVVPARVEFMFSFGKRCLSEAAWSDVDGCLGNLQELRTSSNANVAGDPLIPMVYPASMHTSAYHFQLRQ